MLSLYLEIQAGRRKYFLSKLTELGIDGGLLNDATVKVNQMVIIVKLCKIKQKKEVKKQDFFKYIKEFYKRVRRHKDLSQLSRFSFALSQIVLRKSVSTLFRESQGQ